MSLFLDHAALCPPCRLSYEGERDIVALIRARVCRTSAPADVVAAVLGCIAREDRRMMQSRPSRIAQFLRTPLAAPAIVLALSCAAILLLLCRSGSDPPPPADRSGDDMISQSVMNYSALLKGTIVPQVVSDVPDRVRAFFDGKTEFPVIVPVMKECTLVGGVLNDYRGVPLAHVMYKHGNQTIYVYQACRATVMEGKNLRLPPEALREIERSGCYRGTTPNGDGIVVWVKGATICAAVASMKGEHLLAHLADAGEAGGW